MDKCIAFIVVEPIEWFMCDGLIQLGLHPIPSQDW